MGSCEIDGDSVIDNKTGRHESCVRGQIVESVDGERQDTLLHSGQGCSPACSHWILGRSKGFRVLGDLTAGIDGTLRKCKVQQNRYNALNSITSPSALGDWS